MEVLSLLVENYEMKHHFIGYPKPIEAIQFRIEQMNLKLKDIAPLFGGIGKMKAVFSEKRPFIAKYFSSKKEPTTAKIK